MGQIEEGPYFSRLKELMPHSEFWPSSTPVCDFNTIANARHIASSVSSFSWLAAWLSSSATAIHLPVCGILNPLQRPDVDLLPYPDSRFHYYQFPVAYWRNTTEQIENLRFGNQIFTEMSQSDVVQLKSSNLRVVI